MPVTRYNPHQFNRPHLNTHGWRQAIRVGRQFGRMAKSYMNRPPRNNGSKKRTYASRKGSNPSVISQTDWKVGRRVKGRKKVLSIVHRKKQVKVSYKLRKKVQKVIDGVQHKGTYSATRQGTIGVITQNTSNIEYRSATQGGYTAQLINTKMPDDLGANTRHWWGGAQTSDDGFTQGDEFQFFTPLKILDAASVLWNQKTAARDYSVQAGNLNTAHNQGTGVQVVGSVTAMEIRGLKIKVQNSYVKWIMKNNSQRSLRVEMYKCVPVTMNPLATPLATFADACDREADSTTSSGLVSVVGPFNSPKDDLVAMPGVEPSTFKSFNYEWKYEKVILKMAPGETTSLFCQGPKDYVLDFDKLNKGVASVQHLAYKQTSMSCMFAVTPDLVFATAGTDGLGQSGRWIANQAVIGKIGDQISVEFTEHYSLIMPDIVGFQNGPAEDDANMYTLNKRLSRRAWASFVDSHSGTTAAVYDAFDTEQPGTAIPAARDA